MGRKPGLKRAKLPSTKTEPEFAVFSWDRSLEPVSRSGAGLES